MTTTQSLTGFVIDHLNMGFADLSIADIAAEYNLSVEKVFHLCDQLGVTYKNHQTNLALEDAKAIISQILSEHSDASNHKQDGQA
jgi:predicted DNA-binding protein YlxM (UPF0122 family)